MFVCVYFDVLYVSLFVIWCDCCCFINRFGYDACVNLIKLSFVRFSFRVVKGHSVSHRITITLQMKYGLKMHVEEK